MKNSWPYTLKEKKIVLLIDEAQAIPEQTMENLRLVTNLETEKAKLLQVVLFGQPELDTMINKTSMRQLKQRITFSYDLKPLSEQYLEYYLSHRMNVAGYEGMSLFKHSAIKLLSKGSQGIPRLINVLCHKALLVAYGTGDKIITPTHIRKAIKDTESAISNGVLSISLTKINWLSLLALLGVASGVLALRFINI